MMQSELPARAWSILVTHVVTYAPTILATLVLLLVGLFISWLLGALTRKASLRFGLDRQIEKSGLSESLNRVGLSKSTSAILGRLVFWLVFLCFLVIALENLGLDLSDLPVQAFLAFVPRLIGAVILLIGGLLLATLLGRATGASLAGMGVTTHQRLGAIVSWILMALTVIATVDHLGFDVGLVTDTFSNLITIVAAGIALAFAWGGREVARNVLAAYYVKENFELGDTLVVDGHQGRLEEVGTLNSQLVNPQGSVSVPNSRLVEGTVEIRSAHDSADRPEGPKS